MEAVEAVAAAGGASRIAPSWQSPASMPQKASPATGSPRDDGAAAAERRAAAAAAHQQQRARALMKESPFMSTVVAARKEERRRIKWKIAHGVPGVALGDEGAPARRTRRRRRRTRSSSASTRRTRTRRWAWRPPRAARRPLS